MSDKILNEVMGDKFSNIISAIVAFFGIATNYLYGGWTTTMSTIVFFMAADFMMGMLGGKYRDELSSERAFTGIAKKIAILGLIAVAYRIDAISGANGAVINLVIFFYLGQEGLSIIENAAVLGIPIPESLKKSLLQLADGEKKDISKVNKEDKTEEE